MRSKAIQETTLFMLMIIMVSCSKLPEDNLSEQINLTFFSLFQGESPADGGEARKAIREVWTEQGFPLDYQVEYLDWIGYLPYLQQQLLSDKGPMAFPVYYNELKQIHDLGILLPLDGYLEEMTHYNSLLKPELLDKFRIDGTLYAFPSVFAEGDYNGSNFQGCAIRTDWLEHLHLSPPETLSELEHVLKAFTEMDPDGNGVNDTVGMSIDTNLSPQLWGAYGVPFFSLDDAWVRRGDKLFHATTLFQTGEILKLLSRWYGEGWIDFGKVHYPPKEIIKNDKAGMVYTSAWHLKNIRSEWRKEKRNGELEMMAPVTGPRGKGYPHRPGLGSGLALSKTMTKKERMGMIMFLDWLTDSSDDGGLFMVNHGKEGEDYIRDEKGVLISTTNYSERLRKGYAMSLNFIRVLDNSNQSIALKKDFALLNASENLLISENYSFPDKKKEIAYSLEHLWPKTVLEVITGVRGIEAWYEYCEQFPVIDAIE